MGGRQYKSGHPISEVAAVVRFFPKMKHSSLISGSKIGIIAESWETYMSYFYYICVLTQIT